FFSSRRRHTRFDCDWSSDVCSSDLGALVGATVGASVGANVGAVVGGAVVGAVVGGAVVGALVGWTGALVAAGAWGVEHAARNAEIGRASCRERVWIAVCAWSLEQNW